MCTVSSIIIIIIIISLIAVHRLPYFLWSKFSVRYSFSTCPRLCCHTMHISILRTCFFHPPSPIISLCISFCCLRGFGVSIPDGNKKIYFVINSNRGSAEQNFCFRLQKVVLHYLSLQACSHNVDPFVRALFRMLLFKTVPD
jgi:hypothetical protein